MIWLVGGEGMLGREVRALLLERGWPHVSTDAETDIRVEGDVMRVAEAHHPRWIVNCAAYTAVDRAETQEEQAYAVNALGAELLARAARAFDARLIHVSTDYVFNGRREGPYPEDAAADPIGAYGRTKAAGEALVRQAHARHFIVRTAWLHGPHGPNFVATMLRLMAERPQLRVVDDQHGSPTYAVDLAEALLAFIAHDADCFGTFHYTNDGACSWHGFAEEIQTQALAGGLLKAPVPILPIPTSGYPTPAVRPANSVLAKDRIRAALSLSIPSWQDGLARHLRRRTPGTP